jgi:hypothetical protein
VGCYDLASDVLDETLLTKQQEAYPRSLLLHLNLSKFVDLPGPNLRAFESALSPEFSAVLVRAEGNADTAVVGRCTLTVSKLFLKEPMVSALEATI